MQRGLDRPFHWAWTFFGPIVYVIARSVVVWLRLTRGLLPIWAYIGVFVVSMIGVITTLTAIFSATMSSLDQLS